ncbi:MAG TPA: Fe-S protein assembly co-chaperone HscB [Methylotenera sp.]
MSNAQNDYFQLFTLPEQFDIDTKLLEANFRKIQSASHPDRFVSAEATEKLASMQLATLSNEAYGTLKNAARRAKYLLEKQGIDAVADTNTALPMDFLMQQMEWREQLEDAKAAKDIPAMDKLLSQLRAEAKTLESELSELFDDKKDYTAATEVTRKLIFIDKVCSDIQQAIEYLD